MPSDYGTVATGDLCQILAQVLLTEEDCQTRKSRHGSIRIIAEQLLDVDEARWTDAFTEVDILNVFSLQGYERNLKFPNFSDRFQGDNCPAIMSCLDRGRLPDSGSS